MSLLCSGWKIKPKQEAGVSQHAAFFYWFIAWFYSSTKLGAPENEILAVMILIIALNARSLKVAGSNPDEIIQFFS
jgi:hypothetical protein